MTVREATNSVSFLPPPPITLSSLGTSPPKHNQDQVSPSNVSFPINGAMILPVCTVLGLSPMHFHTPYAMSCWLTWVPPFQPQVTYSSLSPSSHVFLHSNHFNQHLLNTCCQTPCLLLRIKQINQTNRLPFLLSD